MQALSAIFDQAAQQLTDSVINDGYLYSGNRHESVPRALFLDCRLTPLERNTWQIFRLLLNRDGITAFPTYEQLRPYLANTPGTKASHETVARALTLLRLTRWISLVRRRRDPKTGRMQGNLYVLHDEPLTPFEAMQLDPLYLELVSHALSHSSKVIQAGGQQVLLDISDDPRLKGCVLPTRLQILTQRLKDDFAETYPQEPPFHESEDGENGSEEGQNSLLRNGEALTSETEAGEKPTESGTLRMPKSDSTSTVLNNKNIKEVRTVPRTCMRNDLSLPERFTTLKPEQQSGALTALAQLDVLQQQAVLDEWDSRCNSTSIRNPAGYLFGVIQKALRGEFKAWAGLSEPSEPTTPPTRPPSPPPVPVQERTPPEEALKHIANIKKILGMR